MGLLMTFQLLQSLVLQTQEHIRIIQLFKQLKLMSHSQINHSLLICLIAKTLVKAWSGAVCITMRQALIGLSRTAR
ncbi:unnamed protein product [Blepharisma stoltei]|uniref:Uncharacterized protein n=1 Tax=Blepharisma stoltei TaxID=1481888 RepID=A0AAU9JA66_9CILI|nr:unnamed protein product [Blepharisma stoltei]